MYMMRAEATNARVAWFSVGSLLICVVLAAWQLYYLKQFFHKCVDDSCAPDHAQTAIFTHTAFCLITFTDILLCLSTGRSCCDQLMGRHSRLRRGQGSQHSGLCSSES